MHDSDEEESLKKRKSCQKESAKKAKPCQDESVNKEKPCLDSKAVQTESIFYALDALSDDEAFENGESSDGLSPSLDRGNSSDDGFWSDKAWSI